MKSAYHIFKLSEINASLTAYAAVHLRQKRGRDLDKNRFPEDRLRHAKPDKSPVTPPPRATTRLLRSSPFSIRHWKRSCTVCKISLCASPAVESQLAIPDRILSKALPSPGLHREVLLWNLKQYTCFSRQDLRLSTRL